MAAAWPDLAELKQRLNVESDDWDGDEDDSRLSRILAAAITKTKQRVGDWVEGLDQPNEAIAQSALELAVEEAQTGPVPAGTPKSIALLYGQRRRFGIG